MFVFGGHQRTRLKEGCRGCSFKSLEQHHFLGKHFVYFNRPDFVDIEFLGFLEISSF